MAKWVKNESGSTKTYVGVEIADGEFYEIPYQTMVKFENCAPLLGDLASGSAKMSKDGSTVLSGLSIEHINYLRSELPISSETGALTSSPKYAPDGWSQKIHEIEFQTSQMNSIHDKTWTNTDYGWGVLKFYNSNGDDLTTQGSIDTDCVRTDLEWMPNVDYMIKGGLCAQRAVPASSIYIWVQAAVLAPEYGGPQATFCDGGMNMIYVDARRQIGLDGVSGTILYYSHPLLGPGAGTNKLRFIARHEAGFKHYLQIILNIFRA